MEQVEAHVYGKRVYLDTELWHLHKTTLHNVSASAALSYVRNNCSVKLFPPALKEKRGRVRELMMGAKEMEIPIVILRRNVADSFASFKAAMSSGDWARVLEKEDLDNEGSGESFDGEGLEKWQNDTRAFFDGVVDIAKEGNVNFDELYYEDIKKREWVWLRVARCYIRSCNYG